TAMDLEAQKLRLGLSKEGLRQNIISNENFQDASGKFSQEKYQTFLQRIGYNAPFFEHEYRSDLIRQQIQSIFSKSGVVPGALTEAFNRYINEQRILSYFTLGAAAAGEIPAPSDAELRKYYEERKSAFKAPELRKVAVLALTPQSVASKINVSDEDVKAEYDARATHYA